MTQEGEKHLTGNHHSLCVLGGKHTFLVFILMPFLTNPLSSFPACIEKLPPGVYWASSTEMHFSSEVAFNDLGLEVVSLDWTKEMLLYQGKKKICQKPHR